MYVVAFGQNNLEKLFTEKKDQKEVKHAVTEGSVDVGEQAEEETSVKVEAESGGAESMEEGKSVDDLSQGLITDEKKPKLESEAENSEEQEKVPAAKEKEEVQEVKEEGKEMKLEQEEETSRQEELEEEVASAIPAKIRAEMMRIEVCLY